jgi:hypothetical protein
MQEVFTYIILTGAIAYLSFRFFWKRKAKSCSGCEGACTKIDVNKISLEPVKRDNR